MRARTLSEEIAVTMRSSQQRVRRLARMLGVECLNVPRSEPVKEFSKVSQHPTAFARETSRLIEEIQDEDRHRLLEPTGPKILRGRPPIRRPQTAILAYAAQAAYERRMAREKFEAALASLSARRWA